MPNRPFFVLTTPQLGLGKTTQNFPASAPLPSIEGGLPVADGTFGGGADANNSGVMQYVRIEFPGVAYSTDNEINGLTMGGAGSGTTLDHIQVSYSGDDSCEWFGGAVHAKYQLAAGPQLLTLPTLPAGLYLANVTTAATSESVRFVVAK